MDNYIIWRMPGTSSGAYCQQWIAIRGATCICDAVFELCAEKSPLIVAPDVHYNKSGRESFKVLS